MRGFPPGALLAGLLTLPLAGHGDEEQLSVDAEFLEFLGTLDSDDPVLNEYLAMADTRKPGAKQSAPQPKPAPAEDGESK